MSGSVVLLNLAGAVALMLFATRMVKTGVERAYGDILRRKLRGTMRNPLLAVLVGAALAIAFQSSTAVTLLVGSPQVRASSRVLPGSLPCAAPRSVRRWWQSCCPSIFRCSSRSA